MAERKLIVQIVGDERDLARSFTRASRASQGFNRDISRLGRGALVGTGALHGLGRAAAFASTAFVGGAGITAAIVSTVRAAEESQKVINQTAVAVNNSGQSWALYGKRIREAALEQSKLTGFDDERLLKTFASFERRTGDVNKALALNALAANVARGAQIDLESATKIVLRASIGQARGLANLGVSAKKGATGVQLLTALQEKFGGSAAAATKDAAVAQERFQVAVQNTQEVIGTEALPAITKYLNKGADWLNQSENQERVQRDVAEAVRVTGEVARDFATVATTVSDKLGGWKNTIEVLVSLKVATTLAGWVKAFQGLGIAAGESGAAGEVGLLTSRLTALSSLGPIVATIVIAEKTRRDPHSILDRFDFVRGHLKELEGLPTVGPVAQSINAGLAPFKAEEERQKKASEALKKIGAHGPLAGALPEAAAHLRNANKQMDDLNAALREAAKKAGVSTKLRNTWFDALIGRREDRVQDISSLQGQVAEYDRIAALIQDRIAKTKDITRRLNLEDELVSVRRSRKSVLEQIAQDAKDAAEKAARLSREAAEKVRLAVQGRQFAALGLGPTGEAKVPGLKALRNVLGNVSEGIAGSFLDTKKTHSLLSGIRRVLSGGLGTVSAEVRTKVQQILGDFDRQLKDHETKTTSRRRHFDTSVLLAGLGLSPDQIREARLRLAQISPGGTVPNRTGAFALAGGNTYVMHNPQFHGVTDIKALEEKLRRRNLQRAKARRGPYAGRN